MPHTGKPGEGEKAEWPSSKRQQTIGEHAPIMHPTKPQPLACKGTSDINMRSPQAEEEDGGVGACQVVRHDVPKLPPHIAHVSQHGIALLPLADQHSIGIQRQELCLIQLKVRGEWQGGLNAAHILPIPSDCCHRQADRLSRRYICVFCQSSPEELPMSLAGWIAEPLA